MPGLSNARLALVLALLISGAHAAEWAPAPFHATYAVQWKGMNAGTSKLELRRTGADTWRYDSQNLARGIFRLAIPDTVTQSSELRLSNGLPQPLKFRGDDGGEATDRDVTLDFDWQRGRVTGRAEDRPVDLALPTGAQDPMSIQLAQMHAAAAGEMAVRLHAIDKDQVKEYDFTRIGPQKIATALGELDTVIYESRRPGSSRVIRLWMAPTLGFLPVRAERRKGGKLEFSMAIREFRSSAR
jgi:hypothetical protein